MGFKPLVIALNGPPQIGKGWLAGKLSQILPYNSRIMSFATPIREHVLRQFRWENDPESYATFKKHVFPDGLTGREHLIAEGNGKRKIDIHYWSRQVTQSRLFNDPNTPIIIIDDLGFPDEQTWLDLHAERFMTIVMSPTKYSVGCYFDGDSRVCLPHREGIRAIDSNNALRIFIERLTNAQHLNTPQFERTIWFDSLLGRHLVE